MMRGLLLCVLLVPLLSHALAQSVTDELRHCAAFVRSEVAVEKVARDVKRRDRTEREIERDKVRARLRCDYLKALERLTPGLHHIEVRIMGGGANAGLFGVHPFFSRISFDVGELARGVEQWMQDNHNALRRACIYRVGVMDKEDPSNRIWHPFPYKGTC